MKNIVPLLLVLSVAIVGIFWWLPSVREQAIPSQGSGLSMQARSAASRVHEKTATVAVAPGVAASVPGVMVAMRNASTALAALDVLKRLESEQPAVAMEYEADVADACGRFAIEGSLVAIHSGNQWVLDRLKSYCERYALLKPPRELSLRAIASGQRAKTAATLATVASENGVESAKVAASKLIVTAPDPYSVDEAARYLTTSTGGWDLGIQLPDSSRLGINLADAQTIAVEMYKCEVFGGCGPRDLLTLAHCAGIEVCRPDDGFLDLLRSVSKPVDYRLAEQLLGELRKRRTEAGARH